LSEAHAGTLAQLHDQSVKIDSLHSELATREHSVLQLQRQAQEHRAVEVFLADALREAREQQTVASSEAQGARKVMRAKTEEYLAAHTQWLQRTEQSDRCGPMALCVCVCVCVCMWVYSCASWICCAVTISHEPFVTQCRRSRELEERLAASVDVLGSLDQVLAQTV